MGVGGEGGVSGEGGRKKKKQVMSSRIIAMCTCIVCICTSSHMQIHIPYKDLYLL